MKDSQAQSTEKKTRRKIDSELKKIDTIVSMSQPFGSIATFEEFLAQAEKMYKAYDIEFKKEKFDLVKKPDGDNKKDSRLPR